MKFKHGLILASLLILPGFWAFFDQRILGISRGNDNISIVDPSTKTRIIILLILSVAGVLAGLNTKEGTTGSQKVLRVTIIVTGVLTMAILSFPLM
jgi:hypothetical protein